MVSVYDIKPAFQGLLRPVVKQFAKMGITANQTTLLAAVLSIVVGGVFYFNSTSRWVFFLIPVFLFIRMALNAIDGMLAREHNMKSNFGAILNEIGDVVSDTALYLPFAALTFLDPRLVVLIVVFAVISEMMGVVAIQIGADRRYEGPMGKSDRAFVFGAISLVIGIGVPTEKWLNWGLVVILSLLMVTIFNRGKKALEQVK